jgi:hypothetical protein
VDGEAAPAVGRGQGGLAALEGAAWPGSLIDCVSSALFAYFAFLLYCSFVFLFFCIYPLPIGSLILANECLKRLIRYSIADNLTIFPCYFPLMLVVGKERQKFNSYALAGKYMSLVNKTTENPNLFKCMSL